MAEEATINGQYYVVDIELQTVEEFSQLLERAEQLLLAGTVLQDDVAEVTFVLHGPVVRSLLRQNYLAITSEQWTWQPACRPWA